MPGIVNAHTHVGSCHGKGLTEDRENGFYKYGLAPAQELTQEDVYHFSILGLIETVKAGATCINEQSHFMEETAKAIKKVGLRAILAETVFETDYGRMKNGDWSRIEGKGESTLNKNISLIEKWHNKVDGRIKCRIGPHAPDTLEPELLLKCKETARKYDVGLHIHAAQSKKEVEYVRRRYGGGSIQFLYNIGFLDSSVLVAHMALIDNEEIELFKRSAAKMLHCPIIMAKRGQFPPMNLIYEAGVPVALGTDWLLMDPWENMRCAILLSRVNSHSASSLNAARALEMATIGGARVLGLDKEIGTLEAGKKADLITINIRKAHMFPMHSQYDDIISNIVYYANSSDVDNVIVDGKLIVSNHNFLAYDESSAIEKAQATAEDLWDRSGIFR
jgi:5-methylthioadenosine/S-adenosylhomocysteine deaminase